jgi:hypothetical protein
MKDMYDAPQPTPSTTLTSTPGYEKNSFYMSPTPQNIPYQTPPPHYMSPRTSLASNFEKQEKPARSSHIYYLNTPPHAQHRQDPIYEPVPGHDGSSWKPPPVPPLPLGPPPTKPASKPIPAKPKAGGPLPGSSGKTLVTLPIDTSSTAPRNATKHDTPDASNNRNESEGNVDSDDSDYEYMTSVGHIDFSSATI